MRGRFQAAMPWLTSWLIEDWQQDDKTSAAPYGCTMTEGHGEIALFPLDTVLVPGLVFPLHIFEPRYRQLLRDVLAQPEEDREFGVVAVRSTSVDGSPWHRIGTTARIGEVDAYPDGRSDITTVGHRRFEVESVISEEPYLRARVRWLPEDTQIAGDDPQTRTAALRATALFARYRGLLSRDDSSVDDLPDDPHLLSYVLTAAIVAPTAWRQQLLECTTTSDRLSAACGFLVKEVQALAVLPSLPFEPPSPGPGDLN